MRNVEFCNGLNEFNEAKIGEMFWAINGELASPVEEHFDTEITR